MQDQILTLPVVNTEARHTVSKQSMQINKYRTNQVIRDGTYQKKFQL